MKVMGLNPGYLLKSFLLLKELFLLNQENGKKIKRWESFWIYQLNSTVNQALFYYNFCHLFFG